MEDKKKNAKGAKWGIVCRKNTLPIVKPSYEKTLPAVIKPEKTKS